MVCVTEVKGDLFQCPSSWSLAHCISADCKMGKGIAVIFKTKFGQVNELLKQGKAVGEVAVLDIGGKESTKFVYYLVTKEKYWQKPNYESLRQSLLKMREHCEANGVEKVAMPKIGCGLDRLQWTRVKEMLNDIFADTRVGVTVYYV